MDEKLNLSGGEKHIERLGHDQGTAGHRLASSVATGAACPVDLGLNLESSVLFWFFLGFCFVLLNLSKFLETEIGKGSRFVMSSCGHKRAAIQSVPASEKCNRTLTHPGDSSETVGFSLLLRVGGLCRYSSLLTALWIFVLVVVACVRSTVAHVAGFVCAITATSNVEASAERLHLDAQHKGQGDDGQEECELHCVC